MIHNNIYILQQHINGVILKINYSNNTIQFKSNNKILKEDENYYGYNKFKKNHKSLKYKLIAKCKNIFNNIGTNYEIIGKIPYINTYNIDYFLNLKFVGIYIYDINNHSFLPIIESNKIFIKYNIDIIPILKFSKTYAGALLYGKKYKQIIITIEPVNYISYLFKTINKIIIS